jgi:zinc D-Ala-D-Ala carboxypeptidase
MMTEDMAKAYKLSKNFTLHEFLYSQTAFSKGLLHEQYEISEKEILNLKRLCENVLQPLRDHLKTPIKINSGFRSEAVNTAIGGSKTSDHMKAMAADIHCSNFPKAFAFLKTLKFRQLIQYGDNFRFIHVSYNEFDNKCQVLKFD